MSSVADEQLWKLAVATLLDNWQQDHTVPSRTLYPHQWSWDAGFIALGLAQVAPERAWQDLRTLLEAQWEDGRVPHIAFDAENGREYFPGPKFWRSAEVAGAPERATSGIVQPPIHALAAWEIYRQAPDMVGRRRAAAELAWLYPRLVAQQRYLAKERDVGGGGLACLVHPWESGLDNSPAWDEALAAVPPDPEFQAQHHRRDLAVSVESHRPTDTDYARYIALARTYRKQGYLDKALDERHLFLVECPAFNAIVGAAEHALAQIAEVVGEDPAVHYARAAAITRALVERLYNPATGMFHARDLRTSQLSPKRCISGLVPLVLPDLPREQVAGILAEAASPRFGLSELATVPLPSYDRTATDSDPLRYWRGPVWMNVNWLLWHGLRTHGQPKAAASLRRSMIELVRQSGCFEYFHPDTGAGIGTPEFSWTASLTLDLLAHSGERG